MTDQLLTDETLKNRAIELALAGNIIEARHTAGGIVDKRYLAEATADDSIDSRRSRGCTGCQGHDHLML